MSRALARAAVVAAMTMALGACGDDPPSLAAWCGLVADGAVVPLDAPDAVEQWTRLETAAPDDLRDDVERLRVVAGQVAQLDPGDLTSASRLVLTPVVVDAHGRVVAAIGSRCRIDPSNLTVIDQVVT